MQVPVLTVAAPLPGLALFVRVQGVAGSSTDDRHRGWSDATAFGFGGGGTVPLQPHTGAPTFDWLAVAKRRDAASGRLLGLLVSGKPFEVELAACKPGPGAPICPFTLILHAATVAAMNVGPDSETIAFSWAAAEWNAVAVDPSGRPGLAVHGEVDLRSSGASLVEGRLPDPPVPAETGLDLVARFQPFRGGGSTLAGYEDWSTATGFLLLGEAAGRETAPRFTLRLAKRLDPVTVSLLDQVESGKRPGSLEVVVLLPAGASRAATLELTTSRFSIDRQVVAGWREELTLTLAGARLDFTSGDRPPVTTHVEW